MFDLPYLGYDVKCEGGRAELSLRGIYKRPHPSEVRFRTAMSLLRKALFIPSPVSKAW